MAGVMSVLPMKIGVHPPRIRNKKMWEKWFILSVVACFTFGSVPVWADATTGSEDAFASGGAIVANDADSALDQELLWLQAELTATVRSIHQSGHKNQVKCRSSAWHGFCFAGQGSGSAWCS